MDKSITTCEATRHHMRETDTVISDLDTLGRGTDKKKALISLIGVIEHMTGKALLRKAYPGSYVRQMMGASVFWSKQGRGIYVDFIKLLEIDIKDVNMTALEHLQTFTEEDISRLADIRWRALDTIKQINNQLNNKSAA